MDNDVDGQFMHDPRAIEVLTMGRIGVDLYPEQIGAGLEDVATFSKSLGGTAANVAVAAARFGRSSALLSRVGDDPFGRYLIRELGRFGVDNSLVGIDDQLKTPITFCEIFPPESFPLYFYREPKAPDLNLAIDELNQELLRTAALLWVTGTGFSAEPSRSAHLTALDMRHDAAFTVLDLDFRSVFWESKAIARRQYEEVLGRVTVAVGNEEECEVAVGETEPHRAAQALLDRGVTLAIVKRGAQGVLASTREFTVEMSSHHIEVVNGLGAGDAFGGALCHGLLAGWDLERTVRFANAAGAIVASKRECSTAMPTELEVSEFLRVAV